LSETSERQQLIDELQLIKERIKKIEDQLNLPISSSFEEIGDIKPHDILTIESVINLINVRNWERLKQFKLKAKILVAATREGSQYGKTRPQEIIIADEKNQRFKLLNWHKGMDQELKDHKDKWVIFNSVYLKENDRRFPDNQFMEFKVSGELRQYNIHSSKKFRIVIVKEKGA